MNSELVEGKKTGYDRLHDKTPFDPSKPRCDRINRNIIHQHIYNENTKRKIPILTNHWYGHVNINEKFDNSEQKFRRSNRIKEYFYHKGRINLS